MTADAAAAALARYYGLLRRHGLNDSHSGNVSLRLGDRVLITPGGCCADTVAPEDMVDCPLAGDPPEAASLDARLHLSVYRALPDVAAIMHSHGPYTVAVTMDGEDFLPRDFEGQYYFGRVPVVDIPYDRYTEVAPAAVAEALNDSRVAVVRGHGIYARDRSLDLAYKWSSSLESSARISWLRRMYTGAGR